MNFIKGIIYKCPPLLLTLKFIDLNIYRFFVIPCVYSKKSKELSNYDIKGRLYTAKELVNSNKSLSRFGDGEIQWMLNEKSGSFEKESPLLINKLKDVITSNNNQFMVALPDAFRSINQFDNRSKKMWGRFVIKYLNQVLPYLNKNTQYYDTSVVRPYIDYKNKHYATKIFKELRKLWNNKNILIVEGNKTRLGVGNNLFKNANKIKRIECPVNYAFESYNKIFTNIISFLNKHKYDKYITLLSLGPTATVMSYDIFKYGYRAIDIGHIDLEYSWYKMHVNNPVNIPYKYVNEMNYHKQPVDNVYSKEYNHYLKEIVTRID